MAKFPVFSRSLAFNRPSVLEEETAAKKAVVSRKSEKWEKSKAARKVTQRTLVCSLGANRVECPCYGMEEEKTASYKVIAKVEGNFCCDDKAGKKSLRIALSAPIKRSSRIPQVRCFKIGQKGT